MGFLTSIGLAIPAGLNVYIPLLVVVLIAWMYAVRSRKRVTAGAA